MKAQDIINTLKALGIYLYLNGTKLKFRAPEKAMTNKILALLGQHKPQICSLLKVGNPYNLPMVIKPSKAKRMVAELLFWSVRWMLLFLTNPKYKLQPDVKHTAKTKNRTRNKKKLPNVGALTRIIRDNSKNSLDRLPANFLDAIITDPPYGLGFMKKKWDKALPPVEIWEKCFRVLKPGAWMVVFCSSRQDLLSRMILNLAEAGFDTNFTSLYWTYANGFPKAHNIARHLRKKGLHREAEQLKGAYAGFQPKPAVEVIIVAMKPTEEKSYTAQALSNGKGVTWMDDCRIPYGDNEMPSIGNRHKQGRGDGYGYQPQWKAKGGVQWSPEKKWKQDIERQAHEKGRFPANLLDSGNILDDGRLRKVGCYSKIYSLDAWAKKNLPFLIVPKPSSKEKNEGLEDREPTVTSDGRKKPIDNPYLRGKTKRNNNHPTVKPLELMCYLIAMFTRPGDTVGDIFAGTGTTCQAAQRMGRENIGIEINAEYYDIMEKKFKARAVENYFEGKVPDGCELN